MPTVKVPLFPGVNKSADQSMLRDEQAELMDGYVGSLGETVRRPGLTNLVTLDTGSNATYGCYWWDEKSMAIAVSNGNVYKIVRSGSLTSPTYTPTNLTGAPLDINTTTFASDGTSLFMAAGGKIYYTNGTATTAAIADPDAPTTASHVAWLDGYLLANNGNNRFYWSDVGAPTSWSSLSFASAEGAPDNIIALHVWDREIYLFGARSLEIWENDGSNPFSRVSGGFKSSGCAAAHSIVKTRQAAYWLNDERRFVQFAGRSIEPLPLDMGREVARFKTVSDCVGYSCQVDGFTFVVFSFPAENRTLVYNETNETWSEWGAFDSSTGLYNRFSVQSIAWCPGWGVTIAGSRSTPLLYRVSSEAYSDASPIRLRRLTGLIDHGTLKGKRSNQLRLRAKRGVGLGTGTPQLMVRWRDDNKEWSREVAISLGDVGDTEVIRKLNNTGIYHTRQWEISCTESVPVVFAYAEEDIDFLL